VTLLARSPAHDASPEGEISSVRNRRAQERGIRRWSNPATGEAPDVHADDPWGNPSSFRVYTPAEMRSAPLRPSNRPSTRRLGDELKDGIAEAGEAGPRQLLKWMGIGVAGGALVLTAFVLLLNLTDDTRSAVKSTRSYNSMAGDDHVPSFAMKQTAATPIGSPMVSQPAGTDFEIADEPTTPARSAKVRKPAGKGKSLVRSAPY
jgi:hypothetical protein